MSFNLLVVAWFWVPLLLCLVKTHIFSNKVILECKEDSITIIENIFDKGIEKGIKDLETYFIEKGHKVATDEIQIGEIKLEKILITRTDNDGTSPTLNFP